MLKEIKKQDEVYFQLRQFDKECHECCLETAERLMKIDSSKKDKLRLAFLELLVGAKNYFQMTNAPFLTMNVQTTSPVPGHRVM